MRWKSQNFLNEYDFPDDDTPIIKGSALKALEDPIGEWGDKIMELMDTVDELYSGSAACNRSSRSLCQSRMYSQSQVVVQLLQVE